MKERLMPSVLAVFKKTKGKFTFVDAYEAVTSSSAVWHCSMQKKTVQRFSVSSDN